VIAVARRGCHVLVSNSTAFGYRNPLRTERRCQAAGLRTFRVPARRAINSDAARSGSVEEFLITNIAKMTGDERWPGD
jgi:hypothetical protein